MVRYFFNRHSRSVKYWAMAITGYATPVKASGFALYAYYAICHKNVLLLSDKVNGDVGGEARAVQDFYSVHLLKELLKLLYQIYICLALPWRWK